MSFSYGRDPLQYGIADLDYKTTDTRITRETKCLRIPRDWARLERTDYHKSLKNMIEDGVDFYEIYMLKQCVYDPNPDYYMHYKRRFHATTKNGIYLPVRFPNCKTLFTIMLRRAPSIDWCYPPRAQFLSTDHVQLLRNTDELDRRIVLGFCIKYSDTILEACDEEEHDMLHSARVIDSLEWWAYKYTHKQMPKRLPPQMRKVGPKAIAEYASPFDTLELI